MTKHSNGLADAKKWFNHDNYKALAKLNQSEWASQIAKRVFIDDALKNLNDASQKSTLNASNKKFLEDVMPELTSTPLSTFNMGYRNKPQHLEHSSYSTKTVFGLTISDISTLYVFSAENTKNKSELFDEWATHNQCLGFNTFGHLKVDLNARDDDIVADFQYWLTNYRKTANLPALKPHPKKTELKFVDWCDDKILQYFDINAWCRWSGKTLTREQVLDLLFKGYDLNKLKAVSKKEAEIITMANVIALHNEA